MAVILLSLPNPQPFILLYVAPFVRWWVRPSFPHVRLHCQRVWESRQLLHLFQNKSFGNLKTFTYLPQHLTYGNINEYCGEVGNIYPSIAIFKM